MKKVKHLKNTKKRNCQFSIESLFIINTDIKKKNCYYHNKNSTTEIVLIRKDKSGEKKMVPIFFISFLIYH